MITISLTVWLLICALVGIVIGIFGGSLDLPPLLSGVMTALLLLIVMLSGVVTIV